MKFRVFFLAITLTALAAAQSAPKIPNALKPGYDRITAAGIRAHLTYLADDLMEGRAPGTRGGELAGKYIAAQLEAMGLEPAGDKSTWFQQVPFREYAVDADKCSAVATREGKESVSVWAKDYVAMPNPFQTSVDVNAPVVFVGYGAVVPRQNIDDYAGVNVKGKIVAIFRGGHPALPPEERAHYGTAAMTQAEAARHGAVGIIMLPTPESETETPFARAAENATQPGLRWIGPDGTPSGTPEIKAVLAIAPAASEAIFAGREVPKEKLIEELKAGKNQSFETAYSLDIHIESKHRDITSPNIVGVRRGSDPKLKDEYVVYSAHYDHLGIGKPVNGDALYNGAWDNATGATSLLNIAGAFAALPKAPGRSVLFVFVTAEEKGLLGSDYFAQYPTVPRNSMVANINIDMIPFFVDYKDVMLGPDRLGMNAAITSIARMMGLPLGTPPNNQPQRGGGSFMTRSDGYSFIKQGVPVVGISLRGDQANMQEFRKLYGTRYHQPNDDMTMPFNWNAGAVFARANFLLGHEVAQMKGHPAWKGDDWLAMTFKLAPSANGSK